MRVSSQPSPVQITMDQKQLENVEYFSYLGIMITKSARCTGSLTFRIATAKAAFKRKQNLCTSKFDLNWRKKVVKMPKVEHSFVWCWNLDIMENRSEIPGKFWNVVMEKDGEDQLHRSYKKWESIRKSQGGEEYPTDSKKMEGRLTGLQLVYIYLRHTQQLIL